MTYSNKKELLNLLEKEHLAADKNLSQNFLFNPAVVKKIIAAAQIGPHDHIVEVGPGLGFLTRELINTADSVHAIELDREIIPFIKTHFASVPNFTLEEGNVLKAMLPSRPYKLVANIPYHITSPLIMHFLRPKTASEKIPDLIVLLVQKEVAEKICAGPGEHSVLSLGVQIFGKPEIISLVSRNDFYPAPKVGSAILKITPHPKPLIKNFPAFKTLINLAFGQKRKTVANSLKIGTLTKTDIENLLISVGVDPMTRPQNLTIGDWQKIVEKADTL